MRRARSEMRRLGGLAGVGVGENGSIPLKGARVLEHMRLKENEWYWRKSQVSLSAIDNPDIAGGTTCQTSK